MVIAVSFFHSRFFSPSSLITDVTSDYPLRMYARSLQPWQYKINNKIWLGSGTLWWCLPMLSWPFWIKPAAQKQDVIVVMSSSQPFSIVYYIVYNNNYYYYHYSAAGGQIEWNWFFSSTKGNSPQFRDYYTYRHWTPQHEMSNSTTRLCEPITILIVLKFLSEP